MSNEGITESNYEECEEISLDGKVIKTGLEQALDRGRGLTCGSRDCLQMPEKF